MYYINIVWVERISTPKKGDDKMLPTNMDSPVMVKFFEIMLNVNASTARGYKAYVNKIEQQQETILYEIDALNDYLDFCDSYLEKTETANDVLYLHREYNSLEESIDKAKKAACDRSLARIERLQKIFHNTQNIR